MASWLLLLNPKAYVIILLMYSQFGAMETSADLLERVGVIIARVHAQQSVWHFCSGQWRGTGWAGCFAARPMRGSSILSLLPYLRPVSDSG
jgi:hypothetical protein